MRWLFAATGARLAVDVAFLLPDASTPMLGKSVPLWLSTFSRATASADCAAAMVGLALNARSIIALSSDDCNNVHHWPGISPPTENCCAPPTAPGAAAVFDGSGACV